MRKIEIKINPSDSEIDNDLKECSMVLSFNFPEDNSLGEKEKRAWINNTLSLYKSRGDECIYVHYFSHEDVYFVGIKEKKVIDFSEYKLNESE